MPIVGLPDSRHQGIVVLSYLGLLSTTNEMLEK